MHSPIEMESERPDQGKDSQQVLNTGDLKPLKNPGLPGYPFTIVLRLRVLQIVCGISALVMGAVALIEERGRLHLGLGVPAGVLTVMAAAMSIHTSRGFGGYSSTSSCPPRLRFLGPSPRLAVPLTILWIFSLLLHLLLTAFCIGCLLVFSSTAVIAGVLLTTALLSLLASCLVLRIDCLYDPD